LIGFAIFVG